MAKSEFTVLATTFFTGKVNGKSPHTCQTVRDSGVSNTGALDHKGSCKKESAQIHQPDGKNEPVCVSPVAVRHSLHVHTVARALSSLNMLLSAVSLPGTLGHGGLEVTAEG